jgi:two-component system nitrogen regulation response regulator GlnG
MERHLILLSSAQDTVAQVRGILEPLKYKVTVKSRLASGLKAMGGDELVLLDLPDGVSALREIKAYCPEATVLVSTERKDVGQAMTEGAYLCIERPLESSTLRAAIRNATDSMSLRGELERLRNTHGPELVLGNGEKMQKVLSRIKDASRKRTPLLLKGDRGTGKALVAEAVHSMSPRKLGPFVQMAFHEHNFEEAFFGNGTERGRALSADGGTIFIRNLGHLGEKAAGRLQRFNEDGLLQQADGQVIHVDARVMASAENLERSSPSYACFPRPILIPSLRERKGDIVFLSKHFLAEAASFCDSGTKELSDGALRVLESHSWPGNVGELKTTIRRACLLSRGDIIEPAHITHDDGTAYCSVKDFLDAKLSRFIKGMVKLERSGLHESVMSEVEKALIEIVLEETGGNQLRTASVLGITRTTLRTKIRNYGIKTLKAPAKGRPKAK